MTAHYVGGWIIARTIVDESTRDTIVCAGSASLRLAETRLRYDEAVSFRLNSRLVKATRTYFYESANGRISSTFADGRPFFVASLRSDGTASAIHVCGEDLSPGHSRFASTTGKLVGT